MTTMSSPRHRVISLLGLVMLLLSLTPAGVFAQSGLTTVGEVAEIDSSRVGPFLEVHVSQCDPGSPTDAAQLKEPCHENGVAGVNLAVTSVDPALGINLPNKVTTRINDAGPGIINTGDMPVGQYRVQVDLPIDTDTFVFHCELRDSDTVVPTQADPSNAKNVFLVTTTTADDVICDVYVIPPTTQPTIEITYRECTRANLPGDGRTFADLDPNCTTISTDPPTFNVRDLNTSGEPVTEHQVDAQGVLKLTLNPGSYDVFTDLGMDQWGEYLFCQYEGQPQYEKTFDPTRGIVTFEDLETEQITCDWFAVQATDEAPATTTPTATTAPTATVAPTATTAPTTAPIAPPATTGTISVTQLACESEEAVGDTSSLAAFQANCVTGIENTGFTLTNDVDVTRYATTLPTGQAEFADVGGGNWRLWSDIPLEAATEYYFCSVDGGAYAPVTLSDRGVASFPGYTGEAIDCQIYVIPENLRGDVTGASVEVHLAACPVGYDGSSWYADCHDNGVGDMQFTLTGPAGEQTGTTVVERTPGPGIVNFTSLPAGDYTLAGGPPQDFGSVVLYCSDPATSTEIPTTFANGMGSFSVAENQSVVCDWYFIPENASGITPTPTVTPAPKLAEIFTTMFICPQGVNVAGSSFSQLDSACTQTLNDVPMTLKRPGGVPISANTGASGDGAVRFYDLTGGDYVLAPTLPSTYTSAAVYCDLDGGNVYQKELANGSTTFVNVAGEKISCSWFVTAKPENPQGPTGSITIREMLCTGDRSTIKDWEQECQPGSSGVTFTVTSVDTGNATNLAPNAQGVAVFTGLPNGYYQIQQSSGVWCRAQAENVDSQSRVGVTNGGNTDVFLYQCNQQIGLPSTGSGPVSSDTGTDVMPHVLMAAASLPLFGLVAWYIRRTHAASVQPIAAVTEPLNRTETGYRFR